MKVAFITLGCKVNSYETDAICDLFVKRGAKIVDLKEEFDACIINTCSVTNQATAKSRKMIRSAIKSNPKAIIAVIGCYSQMAPKEIEKILGVDIVLGNENKADVVELVFKKVKETELVNRVTDILKYKTFENLSPVTFNKTRAFLKIEDGCNNFCSYCIIPYTRGPIRSKPHQDVISEINKIVENGYKEVVLTGIHTGKYRDGDVDFTSLIKKILNETKIKRLRISSIELNEITDEFLEIFKNNRILANHLHLPLQAGSTRVLKMMNRHYTKEEYIKRVLEIKKLKPDISITTDIIVGFPEETVDDFLDTLDVCEKVEFSKIHAFPFSLRKGTKAENLKAIADQEKNRRMAEILALDSKLEEKYKIKHLNTIHEVIIEQIHDNYLVGHTSNYLEVMVPYQANLIGEIVKIKLYEYNNNKLYGEIVG